jgi:hypothetical protein
MSSAGGSRLSEVIALNVIPKLRPPAHAVTTVTPLANWLIACRKSDSFIWSPSEAARELVLEDSTADVKNAEMR